MEKPQFGNRLGFNLCVAPHPTLGPYFGSGRLGVSEGILRQRRKTSEGLRNCSEIGGKVIVDIQTGVTYRRAEILNIE